MDKPQCKRIDEAIEKLRIKLLKLNINSLEISSYNKNYLKKYIDNFPFYMSLYGQLLKKAIQKLKKPVSKSVFVDYGGGCGILSYLAKELGFQSVIFNDIYQISVEDTKIISEGIYINIDYYICGDADQLVKEINNNTIKPDLICSFDVLEHIYDIEKWFKIIVGIESRFSLVFMTSANSKNPYINNRLKKLQIKAEQKGLNKTTGWKEIDLNSSFLEARKRIINKNFPQLNYDEIKELSVKTRGLRKNDIEKVVQNYIKTGTINYYVHHPTNTCDPYTGNWTENLIDLKQLKAFILMNNLKVNITNSFYGYSKNKILNIPKYILNQIIRLLGPKNLFFSPTYTLEVQKD